MPSVLRWSLVGALLAVAACTSEHAPDQEVIGPTEAQDIQKIVGVIEASVRNLAPKMGKAIRDAHPKGHGCVKARFDVAKDIPDDLRKGVFASAQTFAAWIRYSNGSGIPAGDNVPDARGMAIKLVKVPGEKLLDSEKDGTTQDLLMISYPAFFIHEIADYPLFLQAIFDNKPDDFFGSRPLDREVFGALGHASKDNLLEQRFFSATPYRLGETYLKFSARPVDCVSGATLSGTPLSDKLPPDGLRETMSRWLAGKEACYKFAIQRQTDLKTQPVEDARVIWDETAAPFVDVATITIPKQTFDSAAQQTFCENLAYSPWHTLPVLRPVGGVNRVRKSVYEATAKLRHQLNGAALKDPDGTETFASP